MKPLSYFEQVRKMPNKADQFDLRLRIVRQALAYGVKPTARLFDTTAKTVRKWLGRYRQERLAGLAELPRIPITAWSYSTSLVVSLSNYNSDVETVHRTIEDEFYDLENFSSLKDFHQRVVSYQAWYNLLRANMNKDYLAPWQIIRNLKPKTNPALARLPPLMLDWLGPDYITRDELSLKGYDVPWLPSICI